MAFDKVFLNITIAILRQIINYLLLFLHFIYFSERNRFMNSADLRVSRKNIIPIALSSLLGGFLNGFLGAAGGIFLGLALTKIFSSKSTQRHDRRDIYANVQIAMICSSLISLVIYSCQGNTSYGKFSQFALPAMLGGTAGSILLRKMNSDTIEKLFAVLVIWSGIKMAFG